jgi:hypothetical protein
MITFLPGDLKIKEVSLAALTISRHKPATQVSRLISEARHATALPGMS